MQIRSLQNTLGTSFGQESQRDGAVEMSKLFPLCSAVSLDWSKFKVTILFSFCYLKSCGDWQGWGIFNLKYTFRRCLLFLGLFSSYF